MSNAIRFLEMLGQQPAIASSDYADLVASCEVDQPERQALLGRNAEALNTILGGRSRIWCMISTPGEEPDETPPDDGEGDETPDQDESISP